MTMTDQFIINNGVLVDHGISSEAEIDVVIPQGLLQLVRMFFGVIAT